MYIMFLENCDNVLMFECFFKSTNSLTSAFLIQMWTHLERQVGIFTVQRSLHLIVFRKQGRVFSFSVVFFVTKNKGDKGSLTQWQNFVLCQLCVVI